MISILQYTVLDSVQFAHWIKCSQALCMYIYIDINRNCCCCEPDIETVWLHLRSRISSPPLKKQMLLVCKCQCLQNPFYMYIPPDSLSHLTTLAFCSCNFKQSSVISMSIDAQICDLGAICPILEGWLKTEPSLHSQYCLTSWWNSPKPTETWPNRAEHRKIRTNRMVFTSRVRRIMRKTLRPRETWLPCVTTSSHIPKDMQWTKDNLLYYVVQKNWLLRCCKSETPKHNCSILMVCIISCHPALNTEYTASIYIYTYKSEHIQIEYMLPFTVNKHVPFNWSIM